MHIKRETSKRFLRKKFVWVKKVKNLPGFGNLEGLNTKTKILT